jgi:hypothetical protein
VTNCAKCPDSSPDNVGEPSLMSHVGRVRIGWCVSVVIEVEVSVFGSSCNHMTELERL